MRVALCLGELHRVHPFTGVPVKEGAALVHRGELHVKRYQDDWSVHRKDVLMPA